MTTITSKLKRKHAESESKKKSTTGDLPNKRVKKGVGKTSSGPQIPKRAKKKSQKVSSMGPPSLPKTKTVQPRKSRQKEDPTKNNLVPSRLRSPIVVRPSSTQIPKSPGFILTPVISSQSTFSSPVKSRDTAPGRSAASVPGKTFTTALQEPSWLPPATRPEGPTKSSNLGITAGATGRYPRRGEAAEFAQVQDYQAPRKGPRKAAQAPPGQCGHIARGMIKARVGTNPPRNVMQFHATDSLGKRAIPWPVISFGPDGPMPRWRLWEHQPDLPLGRDLALDLIRTHRDRTVIRGLNHNSHPRSNDSSIGLGALYWDFEAGPENTWTGLTREELYEFAYKCLEDALNDYISRHEFRLAIKSANLRSIANVEDPLPPIPKPPAVTHFGPGAGVTAWPRTPPLMEGTPNYYFGNRFSRPSMAVNMGQSAGTRTDFLVSRMRHHLKGTLGQAGTTDPSRDPRDETPPPPVNPPSASARDFQKRQPVR
ncbi:hypothetical protein N7454_005647 [Penicillium verhagenii]|nr:hypothetical protein N7454_005647 [Penicillium verhagenii]